MSTKMISNQPLTTELTRSLSPDLLTNEIDRRITKIRPMSTPIDQLSRHAGSRKSGAMVVDYYSVDVKPTSATLTTQFSGASDSSATIADQKVLLNTSNNDIFEISDTILVKGYKGFEADGVTQSNADLVLYVCGKDEATGKIYVSAVNGKISNKIPQTLPQISAGAQLIRMGRAATELDVQTAQFEALPTKEQNNCQIFKMQIEQSTLQRIANKEVEWDFSDSEEAAIYDMRLGMEKTFLFGIKHKIFDTRKKEDVYLTGGIWWQAGKEYRFNHNDDFTQDNLLDMMKEAFTGNGGNKRKVLIGGSDFIGRLNKLDATKMVNATESVVVWGIDFSEIRSKFGKLFVLFSEVFDDCGMSDYGFIFDPEFITKWSHVPFGRQELNLKSAGVRNTDAIVLTEASCLTLRYPAAHMRIMPI